MPKHKLFLAFSELLIGMKQLQTFLGHFKLPQHRRTSGLGPTDFAIHNICYSKHRIDPWFLQHYPFTSLLKKTSPFGYNKNYKVFLRIHHQRLFYSV